MFVILFNIRSEPGPPLTNLEKCNANAMWKVSLYLWDVSVHNNDKLKMESLIGRHVIVIGQSHGNKYDSDKLMSWERPSTHVIRGEVCDADVMVIHLKYSFLPPSPLHDPRDQQLKLRKQEHTRPVEINRSAIAMPMSYFHADFMQRLHDKPKIKRFMLNYAVI